MRKRSTIYIYTICSFSVEENVARVKITLLFKIEGFHVVLRSGKYFMSLCMAAYLLLPQ